MERGNTYTICPHGYRVGPDYCSVCQWTQTKEQGYSAHKFRTGFKAPEDSDKDYLDFDDLPEEVLSQLSRERLAPYITHLRQQLATLREENERLERAIRWACGECPEGTPEFPTTDVKPRYAWRNTLRDLSGVRYEPPADHKGG